MYTRLQYERGLGAGTALQIEQISGQIAAGVIPGVLASGAAASAAAGGAGTILGMSVGLAVPVIGAAIAGVTALVGIFLARNAAYHAQETATTKIVDQAEQLMKQNLAAWNASSKTRAEQQQAAANFEDLWGQVVKACNQPGYGDPGQRCIHDRERGGQWPWPEYYLDPILNDPNVRENQTVLSEVDQAFTGLLPPGSSPALPLLLMGGLLLLAVAN